jgi:tetratricopeptide (TPR) repeat protein
MNREKLNNIYHNLATAEKADIEAIHQLTLEYPYYSLPFEILAKYYYQSNHYKFEDMLRQAAMRVHDRKALYEYIHESRQVSDASDSLSEQNTEPQKNASIIDFLGEELQINESVEKIQMDEVEIENPIVTEVNQPEIEEIEGEVPKEAEETMGTEPEKAETKPEEFVLDGHIEFDALDEIESADNDIIGEEINTEFSFSKNFQIQKEETTENETRSEETLEESYPEITDAMEEVIERGNEVLEDLQEMVNEIQEDDLGRQVAENIEEKTEDKPKFEESKLRKYPIYSIENSYSVEQLEKKEEPKETDEHISGPKDFFAWLNAPKPSVEDETVAEEDNKETPLKEEESQENVKNSEETGQKSNVNLDLIERFITSNPQISRPKREFFNAENMAKRSEVPDLEFVTETLANIYYEQGNYDLAIKAYEKLILQNPSKEAYFADLIKKLKKERK